LAVVLFHADILAMGWMGVQLFFVLSGYLITQILLASKSQTAGAFFGGFYWRRTLRIFPLYYGFLTVAVLAYLLTGHPAGTMSHLPYLVTYTFNFDRALVQDAQDLFFRHLWSLSFEEQFYLFWPLLVWCLPKRALCGLVLLLVVSAPALRYAIGLSAVAGSDPANVLGPLTYCLPFGHLDGFAFGAAVAIFPWEKWTAHPQRWLEVVLLLWSGAGCWNMLVGAEEQGTYLLPALGYPVAETMNGLHIWGYTLHNLLFAAMVMVAVHPRTQATTFNRFLSFGGMVWLGRISYGVYVLHWPLILVWKRLVGEDMDWSWRLVSLVPVLAIVLGLAWLSHRYFEAVFMREKDRFFPRGRT
jgi:peptidoglycan/LPS O-acetylase OafA/YrhL